MEESGQDNETKWTEKHSLGNKEVPGLLAKMKRKGRSADAAERKNMSADEAVEESGEDSNPRPLAKKKRKKNIKSDTAVDKERKEGKGNVGKGEEETLNDDVHVYTKGQKLAMVADLFMNHR